MDKTDIALLRLLGEDADITTTDLSARVNLSVPAINKRLCKLRGAGIIRKSVLLTDPVKIGKPIVAFVLVLLDRFDTASELLCAFANADRDILECYAITGEYDYLLKITAPSIEAFEAKLLRLKKCRGVSKSHTLLALQETKMLPNALPDEID